MTKEEEFLVYHVLEEPEINPSIKLQVGIDDCLDFECEIKKTKFHLKD